MTTKKASNPNTLTVCASSTETDAQANAHLPLRPDIQGALTILRFSEPFGTMAAQTMVDDLRKQCTQVNAGNLAHVENLLVAQASTLDALFHSMARRAFAQEHLPQYQAHMKFALRAQSQSRATLETLAMIKYPPNVAFVKQANIAHGPQQVNNGVGEQIARAQEIESQPNELLEANHGAGLDIGKEAASSRSYPAMETLGEIHRP